VFIAGSGRHAEENVFDAMLTDWQPIEGGTSRGVCAWNCAKLVFMHGMDLGGPTFPAQFPNTPFRMFWRP
jgi:hypothetical protein